MYLQNILFIVCHVTNLIDFGPTVHAVNTIYKYVLSTFGFKHSRI